MPGSNSSSQPKRRLGESHRPRCMWRPRRGAHCVDRCAQRSSGGGNTADNHDAFPRVLHRGEVRPTWAYAWTRFVRSEEHTYELQSLMRSSSAVFSLNKKKTEHHPDEHHHTCYPSNYPD